VAIGIMIGVAGIFSLGCYRVSSTGFLLAWLGLVFRLGLA